jgi:hypothetical protein
MTEAQLDFFPSLDFPGRSTLYLHEIGERIGCTVKHLLTLIDDGSIPGLDLSSRTSGRRSMRVPVESYRAFVLRRLTAPAESQMLFLRQLPVATRRQLLRDITESLRAAAA